MAPKELRKRILKFAEQNEMSDATKIATSIGIRETEVKKQLDILRHDGLLTFFVSAAPTLEARIYAQVQLTPNGCRALELQDHEALSLAPGVSSVWNIYGNKNDNVVQNFGNNVTINQVGTTSALNSIFETVDKMADEVSRAPDVPDPIKSDYAIEAQAFKGELRKSRINRKRVREMLAFLGDVDGTLGLATRLAPWFVALEPHIEKLMSQLLNK